MAADTDGDKRKAGPVVGALRLAVITVTIAAVIRELRTPRAQRSWHGVVAGCIPYDFRPPTVERVRHQMWSPDDPKLLVPTVFGVGWTVNIGRLVALGRTKVLSRSAE